MSDDIPASCDFKVRMTVDDILARGKAKRLEVLGAEVVAGNYEDQSPANQQWQDFVARFAWGECWADDSLSVRDRILILLGALAGSARAEEFEGHARNALRNGITADELHALAKQIAVYCGLPTANMCRRAIRNVSSGNRT